MTVAQTQKRFHCKLENRKESSRWSSRVDCQRFRCWLRPFEVASHLEPSNQICTLI